MQKELTSELVDEVVSTRDRVRQLIELVVGTGVDTKIRGIVVTPFLFETHIDFELYDRAIWMCFSQDRKIVICRDFKTHYQREHFEIDFAVARGYTDWLRNLLLSSDTTLM